MIKTLIEMGLSCRVTRRNGKPKIGTDNLRFVRVNL